MLNALSIPCYHWTWPKEHAHGHGKMRHLATRETKMLPVLEKICSSEEPPWFFSLIFQKTEPLSIKSLTLPHVVVHHSITFHTTPGSWSCFLSDPFLFLRIEIRGSVFFDDLGDLWFLIHLSGCSLCVFNYFTQPTSNGMLSSSILWSFLLSHPSFCGMEKSCHATYICLGRVGIKVLRFRETLKSSGH